ncbi:unnamed protein product [Discosporangium mesarthrocarpum]
MNSSQEDLLEPLIPCTISVTWKTVAGEPRGNRSSAAFSSAPVKEGGDDSTRELAVRWAQGLGGGGATATSKKASITTWREGLGMFEVLVPRGDAMTTLGTTWEGRTLLYVEEGVWLAERGLLKVQNVTDPPAPQGPTVAPAPAPTSSPVSVPAPGAAVPAPHCQIPAGQGMSVMEPGVGKNASDFLENPLGTVGCGSEDYAGQQPKDCGLQPSLLTDTASSSLVSSRDKKRVIDPKARPGMGIGGAGEKELGHRHGDGGQGTMQLKEGLQVCRGVGAEGIPELYRLLQSAGVPWECYRVYAELKRRSYVVRRRAEDSVGWQGRARAGPLPWFGATDKQTVGEGDWRGGRRGQGCRMYTGRRPCTDREGWGGVEKRASPIPGPDPNPCPAPMPVTFLVYKSKLGFKKRVPGPPTALVVICRYDAPMPRHSDLLTLATDSDAPNSGVCLVRTRQTPELGAAHMGPEEDRPGPGPGKKSSGRTGMGGQEGVPLPPHQDKGLMLKLAVVAWDGSVHFFHVTPHDAPAITTAAAPPLGPTRVTLEGTAATGVAATGC